MDPISKGAIGAAAAQAANNTLINPKVKQKRLIAITWFGALAGMASVSI